MGEKIEYVIVGGRKQLSDLARVLGGCDKKLPIANSLCKNESALPRPAVGRDAAGECGLADLCSARRESLVSHVPIFHRFYARRAMGDQLLLVDQPICTIPQALKSRVGEIALLCRTEQIIGVVSPG